MYECGRGVRAYVLLGVVVAREKLKEGSFEEGEWCVLQCVCVRMRSRFVRMLAVRGRVVQVMMPGTG